jgi:hypothetical protein
MTVQDIKNFRVDFENAVTELQKKYDVDISAGTIRYSDSELRFKVTARKGKVAPKLTKEAFQVGDKVKINHKSAIGKQFRVEKIMTKNVRVIEINLPKGRIGGQFRVSPSLLEKL